MNYIGPQTFQSLRLLSEQLDFVTLNQEIENLLADDNLSGTQKCDLLPLESLAKIQTGNLLEGRRIYEKSIEKFEALSIDSKVDLAGVALLLGYAQKVQNWIEPILIAHPDHAIALARLGYSYLLQGENDQAKLLFEKSLQILPERIATRFLFIQVLLSLKEIDTAECQLNILKNLLTDDKTYSELQINTFTNLTQESQLKIFVLNGAFSKAEDWLKEVSSKSLDGELAEVDIGHYFQMVIIYVRLLAENNFHSQASDLLREIIRNHIEDENILPLMLQLSELDEVQGNVTQAIMVIRKAIQKDEENIDLWCHLANLYTNRHHEAALEVAQRAVKLFDKKKKAGEIHEALLMQYELKVKTTLATATSQAQDYEASELLFEEILAINPELVPALFAFGQQKLQMGQFEEAVKLFEKIQKLDPVFGYSALIHARHYPKDDATLERIEKIAKRASLAGEVKASLLFQLAAAWENRKNYDKAFALAKEANDASLKFLKYDPKNHRNECARVRFAFSKSLYENREDYGVDSTLPVFVVGMPRSGTTLVEQIIAGHSEIFGAGELGIIPQRIEGLNRWERHVGSGRAYPDCVDDLTSYVTEGIANGILEELQEFAPEAKHIVDKLPHNFEHIGFIKFLFPKAKIISVRRDPRDIAISNYFTDYSAKYGGMGFAYDLTSIGEQLADHNLMMYHWQQLFPGEILEVHYEDVIENLEETAHKLLEYIGVDWEEDVLKFNELDRPIKTASVWQVRQPIYKTSKEKWRYYQNSIDPLIQGTNAKILPDPVDDMIALPEPGLLTKGVALFNDEEFDEAEYMFKRLLHHNPEHAAANYMVGLVYFNKGHIWDGIEYVENALQKCPWQREWRESLLEAYRITEQLEKISALEKKF